jgi:serine/threonine protein phosphatase PrpC
VLPEVTVHDLTEEWDFMVLACDGIWDVLTNQVRTIKTLIFINVNKHLI